MSTPHKCPVCEGEGTVARGCGVKEECPACKGSCIVWEDGVVDAPVVPLGHEVWPDEFHDEHGKPWPRSNEVHAT